MSFDPEGEVLGCVMMREVGMGLDQSSPKSALVINNVALLVALVGGYHQLSWIISGNSIPNTATAGFAAGDKCQTYCQTSIEDSSRQDKVTAGGGPDPSRSGTYRQGVERPECQ